MIMRGKCDLKGSKADNLATVERHIKYSKILPQIVFTVREWEDNPGKILSKVNEKKKSGMSYLIALQLGVVHMTKIRRNFQMLDIINRY